MPTASINLPDGTKISVDGSVGEVERIVKAYAEANAQSRDAKRQKAEKPAKRRAKTKKTDSGGDGPSVAEPDYAAIVNMVHDCDETDAISEKILDSHGILNRVLLPLYIIHKYFDDEWELTSGDISKITNDLKVKVSTPHASTRLSGEGKKYLAADSVGRKGVPVRYKLNRKGIQYMENLLAAGD